MAPVSMCMWKIIRGFGIQPLFYFFRFVLHVYHVFVCISCQASGFRFKSDCVRAPAN